jgi:hypothetical protein
MDHRGIEIHTITPFFPTHIHTHGKTHTHTNWNTMTQAHRSLEKSVPCKPLFVLVQTTLASV